MEKQKRYRVAIEVESQKGTCASGHNVGDRWITGEETPAGMCYAAFHVCLLGIRVLQFGGSLPWEKPDEYRCACPDPDNPVVFRLQRLFE